MQNYGCLPPNPMMESLMMRIGSFGNHPASASLSAATASKAGFYYTGEGDTVACYSCGLRLNHWQPDVNPLTVHRRLSPQCQFVSQQTNSVPLEVDTTQQTEAASRAPEQISRSNQSHSEYTRRMPMQVPSLLADSRAPHPQPTMRTPLQVTSAENVSQDVPINNSTGVHSHSRGRNRRQGSRRRPNSSNRVPHYLSTLSSVAGGGNWSAFVTTGQPSSQSSQRQDTVDSIDDVIHMLTDELDHTSFIDFSNIVPLSGMSAQPDASFADTVDGPTGFRERVNSNEPTLLVEMKSERQRLSTYSDWPRSVVNIAPEALARAGLFYLGLADRVKCAFCGGILRNWEPFDEPATEHRRNFPSCPFVRDPRSAGNVAIGEEHALTQTLDVASSATDSDRRPDSERRWQRSARVEGQRSNHDSSPFSSTHHNASVDRFPSRRMKERINNNDPALLEEMKYERHRLSSYATWPRDTNIAPEALARAGLFYLCRADRVKCPFCFRILRNWGPSEEPMRKHRQLFPSCPFVHNPRAAGNVALGEDPTEERINNTMVVMHDSVGGEDAGEHTSSQHHNTAGRMTDMLPNSNDVNLSHTADPSSFAIQLNGDDLSSIADPSGSTTQPDVDSLLGIPDHSSTSIQPDLADLSGTADHSAAAAAESSGFVDQSRVDDLSGTPIQLDNTTTTDAPVSVVNNPLVVAHARHDDVQGQDMLIDDTNSGTAGQLGTRTTHPILPGTAGPSAADTFPEDSGASSQGISWECTVCLSVQKNVVFLPCRHLVTCLACSIQLASCPLCRSVKTGYMEVYI